MVVLLLLAAGIAAATAVIALFVRKVNIVPLMTMGVTVFLWTYIIISGLLFWADRFSLEAGLGLTLLIYAVLCLCLLRRRRDIAVDFNIRPYIFLLLILLISIPFIGKKYEFYGTGQDEGVYQTQAINLVYGKTKLQQDFEEYADLPSDDWRDTYREKMENELVGFYNYDPELPFASEEAELSDVSGIFHGIPTFAALLAIPGRIAGIRHMSDIQTVFYFALIIYAYMAMEALNIRRPLKYLLTVLLAFSPLILWVSKSALTEIVLASIIAAFVFCMVRGGREYIFLSCVPAVAFCFLHLTIYTMIPVIVLIYWLCCWIEDDTNYLTAAAISITAFLAAIFMVVNIAGTYAYIYNFTPIYQLLPFIDQDHVIWVFVAMSLIFYAGTLLMYLMKKYLPEKSRFRRLNIELLQKRGFLWAVRILIILFCAVQLGIMVSRREVYQGNIGSFKHLSITGIGACLGLTVPLLAGVLWLIKPQFAVKNRAYLCCAVLFVYCVMVYCTLFRKDVAYYYYYGRYLAPYLVITLLFSGILLNQIRAGWGIAAGLAGIMLVMPPNRYFLQYQDDTRITWDILEDLRETIHENDSVIVSDALMKYCFLPVKAMTGARVYPVFDDIDSQLEMLSGATGGEVYCIDTANLLPQMDVVYRDSYMLSEDDLEHTSEYFPFPVMPHIEAQTVVCSRLTRETTFYDFTDTDREINCLGIAPSEGEFAWINREDVSVECHLDKRDYRMTITQGMAVPLELLDKKAYQIEISMNGWDIGELVLNDATNFQNFQIDVPASVLKQGTNLLSMKCELWSPEEYGSDDTRTLCIALKNIVFE